MHRLLSTATAMVLLPALIALGALLAVLRVVRVEQDSLRRYAFVSEQALEAERLNAESEHLGRMVRAYLLSPHPELKQEFDICRERFERTLKRMLAVSREPRERELLEAGALSEQHIHAVARALMDERTRGEPLEEFLPHVDTRLEPARVRLDGNLGDLVSYQRAEMNAAWSEAREVTGGAVRMYLFAILLAVGLLVAQAVVVMREFHRRRRAQEVAERNAAKHAASEARFAGMVSIAADAIISVDEAQRIILFNAGAEFIFGYGAAEVLGQPLDILLPERFRARHRAFLQAFAEGPEASRRMGARQLVFGLRKSGEEFPAEAAISKLQLNGGHVLTVILRDVSLQKRVEEEQRFLVRAGEILSSSSLDYARTLATVAQLAVQSLADWCIVYLWEGGQVRLPEVAYRVPGKQELAEAIRSFPLDPRRPFLARDTLMGREPLLIPHVTAEHLASAAQGPEHLALLQRLEPRSMLGVPLLANERLLGALMFISSESGRIYAPSDVEFARGLGRLASLAVGNARLYASARHATRARDDVLSIVAHDLRSPLNSIVLGVQGLQRRGATASAPGSAMLETILSSARRMNRLIEDLLDVARLEAGSLSIQVSPQPTGELLREALEAARPQAGGLRLVLDVPEALPPVLADRDRLLQVFSNLLGNALKFTPAGGEVGVGARVEGTHVCFSVRDTGVGIAPEALAHIFDRFWQADRGDRRGAGLGLSITKGLVEAHGGTLRVESAPGQGSTFFFSVPIARSLSPRPEAPIP